MSTYSIESDERTQHKHILLVVLDNCESLVRRWLPGGKLAGDEYTALNPRRTDKGFGSFKINVKTGKWCDFALNDVGGSDPISYYAYINNMEYYEAELAIAREMGLVNERGEITVDLTEIMAKVEAKGKAGGDRESEAECIMPVPDSAQPAPLPKGAGKSHWTYRNADGRLLGYTVRVNERDGGKRFFPLTYWTPGSWQNKHWPGARPIYGLDRLASDKDSTVLVVEGEKAADAGQRMFGQEGRFVVVSWPGGANSAGKADWSALQGRRVWLLPDHDEPGRKAMKEVELQIRDRADSTELLTVPEGKPEKWDIADEEGLTVEWLEGLKRKWLQKPAAMVRAEKAAKKAPGEIKKREVPVQRWTPWPAPMLAALERAIDDRVDFPHPLASHYAALAVAAHLCARRYAGPALEPCSLYALLILPGPMIQSSYRNAIVDALKAMLGDGDPHLRSINANRVQSESHINDLLGMKPATLHLLNSFDSSVRLAERQHSGAILHGIQHMMDLYGGGNPTLEISLGRKTETVHAIRPTLNAVAFSSEKRFLETLGNLDEGCAFQPVWIDDGRMGKPRWTAPTPIDDDLVAFARQLRPKNDLESLRNDDFFIQCKATGDMTAMGKAGDRILQMTGHPAKARAAVVVMRRLATVLAAWVDPVDPVIDEALIAWVIEHETDRLRVEHETMKGKGGKPGVYEEVLKYIQSYGKAGVKKSKVQCDVWRFRDIRPFSDRDELIATMIGDGVIYCPDEGARPMMLFATEPPE